MQSAPMDRLPVDLTKTSFEKTFKGYEPAQVDLFVERARMEVATLSAELKEAHDQIESLRKGQEGYVAQENALKEALILAQRTADELRSRAQHDATEMLEKARTESEELRTTARRDTDELRAGARREAEDLRSSAHREAESIVGEARRKGEELDQMYTKKINDLRWDLERLRAERQRFATDFRTTLEGFLSELNDDTAVSDEPLIEEVEEANMAVVELNGHSEELHAHSQEHEFSVQA
jgi:DivIVA domain-containing protein